MSNNNTSADFAGVQNATTSVYGFSATYGYNTTPGGANAYQFIGPYGGTGSISFAFTKSVDAFGLYLTGTKDAYSTLSLNFSDGASKSLPITNNPVNSGGIEFFGFTDPGASISSVTLGVQETAGASDFFAVDDVSYATTSVPEPATCGLLLAGTTALLGRRRRN